MGGQRNLFIYNDLANCNGDMPGGFLKLTMSFSAFEIISSMPFVLRRWLTTYMWKVRRTSLTYSFAYSDINNWGQSGAYAAECFINYRNNNIAAPSWVSLLSHTISKVCKDRITDTYRYWVERVDG